MRYWHAARHRLWLLVAHAVGWLRQLFLARCLVDKVLGRLVLDLVRQGNVAGRSEAADVVAVFVLDTEERPESTTENFRERDEKGDDRRLLQVVSVDNVEDPVEPEDRVDDHRHVVPPDLLVRQLMAQELVFG